MHIYGSLSQEEAKKIDLWKWKSLIATLECGCWLVRLDILDASCYNIGRFFCNFMWRLAIVQVRFEIFKAGDDALNVWDKGS